MSSGSSSDSEPNRSPSPVNTGPAPTPGHNLQSPQSNSPKSQTSQHSPRSATPVSNRSGSRSPSGESNKSRSRSSSPGSKKSRSRSASRGSSPESKKSGSASPGSRKFRSRSGSRASSGSNRSRSGSNASNRSGDSNKSKTPSGNRTQHSTRSNSPNLEIDDKDKRESSVEKSPQKNKIVSDSEEEGGKEVSAAAIFGDADDISSEEEKETDGEKQKEARENEATLENHSLDNENHETEQDVERVGDMENEEDKENEPEPEPIPETRIDVEIPKISCDLGRDIHFVKLPNFLSVETRPFDPETYEDEIDEEETLDEEGRARLKLKVENTIRWRDQMDKEGNIKKESNARMVRWSDGSYSLHLGSEIFDVYKQPLQGDHNHLFIRQGTGLQGQAVFRTKLSFRPHSTESFTHRKMTLSLADRSQKTSGIKILSQVGLDPDHDRKTLLKKEEEKLKQTFKTSKPRKKDSGVRLHNTSSIYREEDGSDEDGGISLNAIKNKYKSEAAAAAAKGGAIYSSDEEGSDIEARRARKVDKTKALKDSESSEESE